MSGSTLPVLSRPGFPQVLHSVMASEIRYVEQVLGLCAYETPESSWGRCDGGFPCQEPALVSEVESGLPFCLGHFREVDRG